MRDRIVAIGIALVAVGCSGGDPGGGSTGGMMPPPPVSLQAVQDRVFTPSCARSQCHLGPGAPFGLDLSAGQAYGNLVGVASAEVSAFLRVEPFDAADSYLFMKVTDDPRILGDPMPFQGGPLPPEEVALIEDWIAQGASQ